MSSKLPKPTNLSAINGSTMQSFRSKIANIESKMANDYVPPPKPVTEVKTAPAPVKSADENRAPAMMIPAKPQPVRNNVGFVKPAQKRPAVPTTSAIDSKRPNLRTTMKATVRPVRPATTAGVVTRGKPAGTINVTAPAKTNAAPKPSKWDLKGRLELTTNELSALKQKHKDTLLRYKDVETQMASLEEAESLSRDKAEELEKTANGLSKQVVELSAKIEEYEKEKLELTTKLANLTELHTKTAASLQEYKRENGEQKELIEKQNESQTHLKTELDNKQSRLENLEMVNKDLLNLVQDLDRERRGLHNTIQELKGNIRVFCRVRPKIPKESAKNMCTINFVDECTIEIARSEQERIGLDNKLKTKQEFTFDRVFPPSTCQAEVFEELSMLVQSALEGYNVCVFAYGQTGSGKTFTMEGFPGSEDEGMIPRTVKHIFSEMKQFQLLGWEYKIEASFLEIYNEQIVDLLDSQKKSHEIRMVDSKGHDLYVSNLHIQEINNPDELQECLLIAQRNRAVAATQSNERSSRSHSVARIRLIGTHKDKQEICIGNLNLVDLAGSERLKNEEAARTAETKNINKSLANLGHVILALLQKQDHIPYRNSKLTHLLMPSLGGNSKTLMLLNISPLEDSYNETVNSLRFGSNVNSCKTGTIKRMKSTM